MCEQRDAAEAWCARHWDSLEAARGVACRRHLLVLARRKREALPRLLRLEVEMLQELRLALDEYIRKQDYRFRHEPLGEERDAPRRALAWAAGAEGLG